MNQHSKELRLTSKKDKEENVYEKNEEDNTTHR
jgi:hypothetical protein